MTTKTKGKARPYRSGYCGLSNDGASHKRCPGHYRGEQCACSCHAAPAVVEPTAGLRIIDVEQRSDDWYAARCGMVTASAVGTLLTPTLKVAANEGSRGLTATLVGERITQHVEPTGITPDMWRGIEEEPHAVDAYTAHYGRAVAECGFMVRTLDPDGEGDAFEVGYSPDGLVGDDGMIEIKSRAPKNQVDTVLGGHPPADNMPQLQAALLVSGREWVDYISFAGGMHLWTKRVYPDPKWFDAIVAAVRTFEANAQEMQWQYMEAVEGLPMTERTILNLNPDVDLEAS